MIPKLIRGIFLNTRSTIFSIVFLLNFIICTLLISYQSINISFNDKLLYHFSRLFGLSWLKWNLFGLIIIILISIVLEVYLHRNTENEAIPKNALNNNLGYLFIFLSMIFLCINIRDNLSVTQFLSERWINNLIDNYRYFKNSFFQFVINTIPLHEGDSNSGWRSFYYLLPLFVVSKLNGGLNLTNLHLFVYFNSVIFLFLFYYFLKEYCGSTAANIGIYFFVFSAFFQNFARSFSYHIPSLLVAMVLIIFIFKFQNMSHRNSFFFLGLVSGISWYYYGPLRFLFPVAIWVVSKRIKLFFKFGFYFCLGLGIIILPGLVMAIINKGSVFDQENIFYTEPGYNKVFYLAWLDNIKSFLSVSMGNKFVDGDSSLINKILFFPFIIGVVHTIINFRNKFHKLLILLTIAICVFPIFLTSFHYQIRRYILHCIPFYIFIGIGGSRIASYLRVKNNFFKKIFLCIVIFLLIGIVLSESTSLACNVWQKRSDKDILRFGRFMREYAFYNNTPIFYLQENPHKLAERDYEADLLSLILREKNPASNVININGLYSINSIPPAFYIATSPFIDEKSFLLECKEKDLSSRLVLLCSYGGKLGIINKDFRLYFVIKNKI